MRVARFAAAGVVERRAVERQRPIADACERIDDSGERDSLAVVHDARALRTGVHADLGDTGQQAERSLDQPAAGRAAHAVDQHDRFAIAVGEGAHDMARELRPLEGRRALCPIAEVRRANGRSAAQSIVVGESEFADPLGHGATAVAAHRMRRRRRRAPAADWRAAARRNASSRSSALLRGWRRGAECRSGTFSTLPLPVSTGVSAWRAASTIVMMHAAIDATRIAAPSQTTGCRNHAPASRDLMTSSRGDGRRVRLRVDPGRDEQRVLVRPGGRAMPASRRCGPTDGLGDARGPSPP